MIIGILCDFVLNKPHEEWISDRLDSVVQRGIVKNADFIVMSYIGASVISHLSGQDYYVVSPIGLHSFKNAICTFKGDVEFLADMSDLVVIISNEDVHTEWDNVREMNVDKIEINYLTKNEVKYERIL